MNYGPLRRAVDVHARRHIYTITGPSGVYVGCTRDVAHRWAAHRSAARGMAAMLAIHRAMARDGIELYRFEVVACARDLENGRHVEFAVMKQLYEGGARILNTRRAAPGASLRPVVDVIPAQEAQEEASAGGLSA